MQFGIRLTNLLPTPYRFVFFGLMPELLDSDGKAMQRGYAVNVLQGVRESDFLLAMPGESVTFFVDGKVYWYKRGLVYWYKRQLNLRGRANCGGFWFFHNLKPGTYQVRFTYQNKSPVGEIYQRGERFKELFRDLWTGMVSTPFVEFRLVQP